MDARLGYYDRERWIVNFSLSSYPAASFRHFSLVVRAEFGERGRVEAIVANIQPYPQPPLLRKPTQTNTE